MTATFEIISTSLANAVNQETGWTAQGPHFVADVNFAPELRPIRPDCDKKNETSRAIVFEFDQVLCDGSAWLRSVHQILPRFGVRCDFAEFYQRWEQNYHVACACGMIELGDGLANFFSDYSFSARDVQELTCAAISCARQAELSARLWPDVKSTLAVLRSCGWKLAILADKNVTATELQNRLTRFGAWDYFSAVVTSFDLKVAKPARECYERILEEVNVESRNAVLVSSCPRDLQAAAALGWWTVAFNCLNQAWAHLEIKRFIELERITMQHA